MRWILVALAMALAPVSASQAQTPPTAEQLLNGLAGEWRGALGYRDYQTNQLFELPVVTTIRLAEDGGTTMRTSQYDEGSRPDVFIYSLSGFDPDSGLYETAGFRAGRAMSVTREAVSMPTPPRDAEHWTLMFTERGTDDDRVADIRITLTRDGDQTMAVKEVDYLEDPAVHFEFRNQMRLNRVR